VILRGERWGSIHILHGVDQLGSVESYALDRTADAIAITLLGDRESAVRASHRQSSLVNRLLLGDISGEQFVDKSIRIGRDLRDRPLVVIFVCKDPDTDTNDARTLEALNSPMRSGRRGRQRQWQPPSSNPQSRPSTDWVFCGCWSRWPTGRNLSAT